MNADLQKIASGGGGSVILAMMPEQLEQEKGEWEEVVQRDPNQEVENLYQDLDETLVKSPEQGGAYGGAAFEPAIIQVPSTQASSENDTPKTNVKEKEKDKGKGKSTHNTRSNKTKGNKKQN